MEKPLRAAGLPVTSTVMPSGDVEIVGCGPGGRPLLVGVEYKKIPDVLACVRDGRFAEQARKMRASYEVCWLLVEGEWELGAKGALAVRERGGYRERGGHTYQEVAAWLLTMSQRAGVLMWHTRDQEETVAWLRTLYWWWTSKDFEEHRAHCDWYTPPPSSEALFEEPTLVQRIAAVLPGIGTHRAYQAAKVFGSVREMVNATEREWAEIEGIGKVTAKRLVEVCK